MARDAGAVDQCTGLTLMAIYRLRLDAFKYTRVCAVSQQVMVERCDRHERPGPSAPIPATASGAELPRTRPTAASGSSAVGRCH